MLLTAWKTGANCHSSLLPTCTESPILCHTSKSNNRSVVAISFHRRYHSNIPDISPSVNLTLARSANSGRLFCAAFATLIQWNPYCRCSCTPSMHGSAPASIGQPGLPRQPAVPCLLWLWYHVGVTTMPSFSIHAGTGTTFTLMQCTVSSLYCSACVVIHIFPYCTHDHAYSDRLQT